jgi:hypothetical protein
MVAAVDGGSDLRAWGAGLLLPWKHTLARRFQRAYAAKLARRHIPHPRGPSV